MARRETYTVRVECKCGVFGDATFEENENPVHNGGDLEREFKYAAGPFHASDDQATLFCDTCGNEVWNA